MATGSQRLFEKIVELEGRRRDIWNRHGDFGASTRTLLEQLAMELDALWGARREAQAQERAPRREGNEPHVAETTRSRNR